MTDIPSLLQQLRHVVEGSLPALQERRFDITWKPDGSPVTAADVYLEDLIRDWLTNALPGLCFIGEESWTPDLVVGDEWVAVLDPIDGTENFCSGLKEWGTSLSIWRGGKHAGSMLLMPELGEGMTSGAIPRVPRSRIVGFSSSFNDAIGQGLAENAEGRIMGCAVYNLFNVIRGAYARFVNPKGAYSWDLLAGVALAEEAGCEVIIDGEDYDGRFLQPGRRYRVDIRHRYDFHPGEGTVRR
ncbi:inositol monophosphatase family protein [Georhizobium profundi]|uniref:inositol monophosphatase family protein n=1 Tax=Georhizobium profundi TaxID=2341112 RepID=UPI0013E04847|nr:inositol monophosphatase family protein [Georhizobium profundi]